MHSGNIEMIGKGADCVVVVAAAAIPRVSGPLSVAFAQMRVKCGWILWLLVAKKKRKCES